MGTSFARWYTRARDRVAVALLMAVGLSVLPQAAWGQTEPCPTGGQITIMRTLQRFVPTPATFTYEVRGPDGDTLVDTVSLTFEQGHSGHEQTIVHTPPGAAGSFQVIEIDRPPGFAPSPDATLLIDPLTEPPCTDAVIFETNVHPFRVRVVKTETVGRRVRDTAIGKWSFTLSGGPNEVSITKRTNTNGSGHVLNLETFPGGNYTLCERFTGWYSNLGKSSGYYRPNGDRCVDFVLSEPVPEVRVFRVNNRCPLS